LQRENGEGDWFFKEVFGLSQRVSEGLDCIILKEDRERERERERGT